MTTGPMAYDRDVAGLHVEPRQYTFPGDELIDEPDYIAAMSNTYLRKLPFAIMLMKRFAVPPSDQDQERIKRGLVCMGWLDHMLDEAPDRRVSASIFHELVSTLSGQQQFPNVPEWVRPEVMSSVALLRNAIAELPQNRKDKIAQKAQRIGEISTEKAAQKDAAKYCTILTEEGGLSSDVVIECLSIQGQNTDGYARLHAFNARAMVAATLLDAAIDLRQDYEDGLTLVTPSLRNRFFLYGKALRHVPYVVKGLGARGLLITLKTGIN